MKSSESGLETRNNGLQFFEINHNLERKLFKAGKWKMGDWHWLKQFSLHRLTKGSVRYSASI